MKRLFLALLIGCFFSIDGYSQIVDTVDIMKEFDEYSFRDARISAPVRDSSKLREHLLGVKWGMSINSLTLSMDYDKKSITSPRNFGIYYTYYHSLWNSITLFGLETGVQFNEEGYKTLVLDDDDNIIQQGNEVFQNITLPFISQFRIDFWRMRLLANLGCYASYRTSTSFSGILPERVTSQHKKYSYGIVGGGGFAYIFRPFEIHLEANYKYNLSNLYDKKAFYGDLYWISTHTSQLIFSVGLHYRIGGSRYKIKSNAPNGK